MTGYDGIRQSFLTALEDPEVNGICLDIDSPGGEVAGCFDLVDEIYNARGNPFMPF
jgi:ClpP class serine protease